MCLWASINLFGVIMGNLVGLLQLFCLVVVCNAMNQDFKWGKLKDNRQNIVFPTYNANEKILIASQAGLLFKV